MSAYSYWYKFLDAYVFSINTDEAIMSMICAVTAIKKRKCWGNVMMESRAVKGGEVGKREIY
jgi:hypothetical protein